MDDRAGIDVTLPRNHQAYRAGTVRIGTSTAIPEILRDLGVKPAEVFAEAGLDPELFDDSDNVITYAARSRLLTLCVSRTRCDHFGLLVGQRGGLASLGLVGYLVLHSPDVGNALRSLVRFFHLHAQGAVLALQVSKGFTFLSYKILEPDTEACDQIEDAAVAIAYNALRSLCGQDWRPTEIHLSHRKPKDIKPFRRFFAAPLRFDAEESGVLFRSEQLKRAVRGADPELRRLLQKQIDALEASHVEDFPEQVRRVLRTALLVGQASEDQIAALFAMNSRTMRRRLRTHGTGFREVTDQARFEVARQMLENSELDTAHIAAALNYSSASSFARAFKRWSGTTPGLWRTEASSDPTVNRTGFSGDRID